MKRNMNVSLEKKEALLNTKYYLIREIPRKLHFSEAYKIDKEEN